VLDGETGFRFPVNDARALAERLASLAADPALRARLGEGAKSFVAREGLDAVSSARRHLALYRELAR
jgi:glycosyltransferase involved in cell wall biosynthesis